MSRVPHSWSMIPAVMKSDALKVAWLTMWNTAATDDERRVEPDQERDQPEMADRRVGEQALQVVLEHRDVGPERERDQSDGGDDVDEERRPAEHRVEAGEQEHARLHHRRRVQVRRHRRRRRHRLRQPEVERELRALGERAEEDEHEGDRVPRIGHDPVVHAGERGDLVGARDAPDQQEAGEHRQPAGRGDRERHAGALARVGPRVPVADQQERGDARQLPEHREEEQVVGERDAEHRGHEERELAVEPAGRIALAQVVAGVQDDEQADTEDEDREQRREPVEPERDVQAELGHPIPERRRRLAGQHAGQCAEHERERARHDDGKRPRGRRRRAPAGSGGKQRPADERQADHER